MRTNVQYIAFYTVICVSDKTFTWCQISCAQRVSLHHCSTEEHRKLLWQAGNDRAGWTWWNPVERTVRTMKERRKTLGDVWGENSVCCAKYHSACPAQVCCQLARAPACCRPAAEGRPRPGTPLFETAERGNVLPLPKIIPAFAQQVFITHRCDIENHLAACRETRL